MSAITTADVTHHAHVAPMANGSRNVSQAENAVPANASNQATRQALPRARGGPHVAKAHAASIPA